MNNSIDMKCVININIKSTFHMCGIKLLSRYSTVDMDLGTDDTQKEKDRLSLKTCVVGTDMPHFESIH